MPTSVPIIASGYEWQCPGRNCHALNRDYEAASKVQCKDCGKVWEAESPEHAYGSGIAGKLPFNGSSRVTRGTLVQLLDEAIMLVNMANYNSSPESMHRRFRLGALLADLRSAREDINAGATLSDAD